MLTFATKVNIRREGYAFVSVCWFVRPFVSRITQNVVHKLSWNFRRSWPIATRNTRLYLNPELFHFLQTMKLGFVVNFSELKCSIGINIVWTNDVLKLFVKKRLFSLCGGFRSLSVFYLPLFYLRHCYRLFVSKCEMVRQNQLPLERMQTFWKDEYI